LRALDPLFQKEVMSMEEYNQRRELFKRHVKRFYYACRRFDEGLRGRMDAREAAAANANAGTNGESTAEAKSKGAWSTTVPGVKASQPGRRQKKQRPQLEVTEAPAQKREAREAVQEKSPQ
jgi:hypothetical protein